MIELDRKGRSLDGTLCYKVSILIRRDKNSEDYLSGKWKMGPAQELKLAQLYTNVLTTVIKNTIPGTPLNIPQRPTLMYGGHDVVNDYMMPDTEIHFIGDDGQVLARIFNLNADPDKTEENDKLDDQIDHHFKYHSPKNKQIPIYNEIREAGKVFAKLIAKHTPICADQSSALRHVENAVMEANAAIARDGK